MTSSVDGEHTDNKPIDMPRSIFDLFHYKLSSHSVPYPSLFVTSSQFFPSPLLLEMELCLEQGLTLH